MPATAGRPAVQNKNAPTIVGAQFPTSITIRYSNSPVKEKDLRVMANSNPLNRAWFLAAHHSFTTSSLSMRRRHALSS